MLKPASVRIKILPHPSKSHIFSITYDLMLLGPTTLKMTLPTWAPGSYLIREFSTHVLKLSTHQNEIDVPARKTAKNVWQTELQAGHARIDYEIYAFDLSVRASFLDQGYGFITGSSTFLKIDGFEDAVYEVTVQHPHVTTTLERLSSTDSSTFQITGYDDLIDHPILLGSFPSLSFEAGGVPHEIAVIEAPEFDQERLRMDVQKICATQQQFFQSKAPFASYIFYLRCDETGYGGLEHQSSSALLCQHSDLPHTQLDSKAYTKLLGLFSHEYFHVWNVKRLKPIEFVPYDYGQENYTELLWFFEGFTAYYDDLFLCRSQVISANDYLELLANNITQVLRTPGRFEQSLSAASFDAWVKFYRPHENSKNTTVSYYQKGALVALALDLTLRKQSGHQRSLDDVMRLLWHRFGQAGLGVSKADILHAAESVMQGSLQTFFNDYIDGTKDPDLAGLLSSFGVDYKVLPRQSEQAYFGAQTTSGTEQLRITHIEHQSPAQKAGLSVHDILVALDGQRITPTNWQNLLMQKPLAATRALTYFRRGWLKTTSLCLCLPPNDTCVLSLSSERNQDARKGWLGV